MRDAIDGGNPAGGNKTTSHVETLDTLPQQKALTRQVNDNFLRPR